MMMVNGTVSVGGHSAVMKQRLFADKQDSQMVINYADACNSVLHSQ